jgi:hypothetical protein
MLQTKERLVNRTFWDNVVGGVITGVVVAALIGAFALVKGLSIYHLVMGDHLVFDWGGSQTAVATFHDQDRTHQADRDLGKHDVCMLTRVTMQKLVDAAGSGGSCRVSQNSAKGWELHALVDQNANPQSGAYAVCDAVCGDFK